MATSIGIVSIPMYIHSNTYENKVKEKNPSKCFFFNLFISYVYECLLACSVQRAQENWSQKVMNCHVGIRNQTRVLCECNH